ncbi:MAG: hypothetical protein HQK60_14535 [Deltaproteobacteria bacterium]|nr:hypothetical protein [Deltaproteobacteria bacterium]
MITNRSQAGHDSHFIGLVVSSPASSGDRFIYLSDKLLSLHGIVHILDELIQRDGRSRAPEKDIQHIRVVDFFNRDQKLMRGSLKP